MDFKNIAKKAADNNSPILQGREKLRTDELIGRYPDGVTVTGVDMLRGQHGAYAVAVYAEEEGFYFNGGSVFTAIVEEWAKGYTSEEGVVDYEGLSADLAESGGVKMKFEKTTTKSGNAFTKIEIVD